MINVTNFKHNLAGNYGTTSGIRWPGRAPDTRLIFAQISGGYDFIKTTGIKMREGRAYSRQYQTDHKKIIFNEAAVKAMDLENPVGQMIKLWGEDREIIGVTEDFHIDMLYERIMPVFVKLDTDNFASNIMVRLEQGNELATIERIQKVHQEFFMSGMPFEFKFMNENYQKLYSQEIRVGILSRYAAAVAIFISCLGLFGFATFTVRRRVKEIAIRKALGSSKLNIVALLLKSFMIPVSISLLFALPISYLFTKNWLESFAFRMDLEIGYFLLAILFIILVAALTVSFQTLRATSLNTKKYLYYNN